MKANGTLTTQKVVSTEIQVGTRIDILSREQLIELVEAELAVIGGGNDQPSI